MREGVTEGYHDPISRGQKGRTSRRAETRLVRDVPIHEGVEEEIRAGNVDGDRGWAKET